MRRREHAAGGDGPLRLCFVGWADQVHLERWAGYFARRGHDVSVVSFTGKGDYPRGVVQRTIGLNGHGPRWKELKLGYLLWDLKPDLVHVHWGHYAPAVKRAWAGPTVVTTYGSDVYRLDEQPQAVQADVIDGLRRVDVITCDSRDTQQRIVALTERPADHVRVIQWGVDTDLFYRKPPDAALFHSIAGHDRPVVYSARNFTPLYNLDIVVEAFGRVLRDVPDALLVMKQNTGTPEYRAAIEAQIAAAGLQNAVRIVDSMPYERIPDLYRMASVMVSVPSSDGTPMSLLESMACEVPPVVSDLPSLREWISDGWNGYLVAPRDAGALAGRIRDVLADRDAAKTFGTRNREIVNQRASQHANMAQMERIYRQLVRCPLAA